MNQLTAEMAVFSWPDVPDDTEPYLQAAQAIRIINRVLPFKRGSMLYRPEEVVKGEVNCHAQTLGMLMLLEHWGIPAGVIRNKHHAQPIGLFQDEVLYADPFDGHPTSPLDVAIECNDSDILGGLYVQHLTQGLREGDMLRYFAQSPEGAPSEWVTATPYAISDGGAIAGLRSRHIAVDAERGKDMLQAIGDLKCCYMYTPENYEDMYAELSCHVPVFMELPLPSSMLQKNI